MPSDCPIAPLYGPIAEVRTFVLPSGTTLTRFHGLKFPANSFNPNIGKDWTIPDHGARFNPFPDIHSTNVPTVYAGDDFAAAALESVFHNVPHIPSPPYPRKDLEAWRYTELEVKRNLTLLELTNPNLRQLDVPGRETSLLESELIHSQPADYPNTRTWGRYLFLMIPALAGLAFRPRLGGEGNAYVFFEGRCTSADFQILGGAAAVPIDSGPGFVKIHDVATAASIRIVNS